jgi:hypothetical protein
MFAATDESAAVSRQALSARCAGTDRGLILMSAKKFGIGFGVPIAIFVVTNAILATVPQFLSPLSPWRPYDCFDCMAWTGWPHRFIGYGGFFSHWELDWPALWRSLVTLGVFAALSGLVAAVSFHRIRREESGR